MPLQKISGAEAWNLAYRLTQMNREELLGILKLINDDWVQYGGEPLDYDEDDGWGELLEKLFTLSVSVVSDMVAVRDKAFAEQLTIGKYIKLKNGETAMVLTDANVMCSNRVFILTVNEAGKPQKREVDFLEIAKVLGDANIKLELAPQEGENDDTI